MLDTYRKFIEKREEVDSTMEIAPYNWFEFPESISSEWLAYSQMLNEHARELSNSLNELNRYVENLKAWCEILDDMGDDDQKKYQVIFEFVSPIATLAINFPYVIRSRFFYSIAHLCHQANRLKQTSWSDDLPTDTNIYQEHTDDVGRHWGRKYSKLKLALEKVCNKTYQDETLNFRNKYNHRYSPRIEIGITNLVTRNLDKQGNVSYGIGGVGPLKLQTIVPLLEEQHAAIMKAFSLYQTLINEQIKLIKTSPPTPPAS